MKYTNHSGGCDGADMAWETAGLEYGVETIAYSFHNHTQHSYNRKILTFDELSEGFDHVLIANKTKLYNLEPLQMPYMRNLLSRNWFQVKHAESIYAIGMLDKHRAKVDGGTGWAVQMAVDNKKPIHLFDQNSNMWHLYNYDMDKFEIFNVIPTLTINFAGIGTRKLSDAGVLAILDVYEHTFKSNNE